MTTTQARSLLRLARSVERAKEYDQNSGQKCCLPHMARICKVELEYLYGLDTYEAFGLTETEECQLIDPILGRGRPLPTAKQKAAQIRAIVRRYHPELAKRPRKRGFS